MGRRRSFDEAEVISRSAAAFLSTGFEGTSVEDLVAATGLLRGSLYQAFGSKRGLFLACLRAVLEEPDASDLVIVALVELAPRDAEIRAVVAESLGTDAATKLGARLLERAHLGEQGGDAR